MKPRSKKGKGETEDSCVERCGVFGRRRPIEKDEVKQVEVEMLRRDL